MFGEYLSITEALSVVFTGIVVVFLALLILIVFLYLMGGIFSALEKRKPAAPAPAAAPAAPAAQNGLSNDVVAAISTAVAIALEEEGNSAPFEIKSIKKV